MNNSTIPNWIIFLLFLPAFALSQKKESHGFGYVGPEGFLNNSLGSRAGLAFGAGAGLGKSAALGLEFDCFIFNKDIKYNTVHGTITGFLNGIDKPGSYFIMISPGYTLYNKRVSISGTTAVIQKGNFAFDALTGVKIRPGKTNAGFMISFGYSSISFVTSNKKTNYGGVKIRLCFAVGK